MADKKKRIEIIKDRVEAEGFTMAEVLRRADVPYNTIANWTGGDPKPFQTYDKIMDTIDEMSKEKAVV